jgi:subtilisin family serine protease
VLGGMSVSRSRAARGREEVSPTHITILSENRRADVFRVKVAKAWFDRHNSALARLVDLRGPAISENQRVKIAILDSGINLAQNSLEMYNSDPGIQYCSWVDNSPEWKDEVGHGTHLAVLLRKIAPNAIVHVVRVFKKRPTKGSVTSIAQVRAGMTISFHANS